MNIFCLEYYDGVTSMSYFKVYDVSEYIQALSLFFVSDIIYCMEKIYRLFLSTRDYKVTVESD